MRHITNARRTTAALGLTMLVTTSVLTTAGTVAAEAADGRDGFAHYTTVGVHNAYEQSTFAHLTQALDAGAGLLELDIWPKAEPGQWFVSHLNPLANANNCTAAATADELGRGPRDQDFSVCLDNIRLWLEQHPDHDPLIVKVENKGGFTPGHTPAGLDAILREHLGDRIYRPADLLAGHDTLDAAARADAWPSRSALRGKILVQFIPGYSPMDVPVRSITSDIVYATHLQSLEQAGRIEDAQMFPAVMIAQAGDPRLRYHSPELRNWFVVFDGHAVNYVDEQADSGWYDRNHYLLVMTKADEVPPALGNHNPDPRLAGGRARQLAAAHASVLTSDWDLPDALGLVLPRGEQ